MVTICGMAPDWDIKRCRTLPIMEAAEGMGTVVAAHHGDESHAEAEGG